jgi:peptide-methionine (S)-S-oxide reductase
MMRLMSPRWLVGAVIAAMVTCGTLVRADEGAVVIPAPALDVPGGAGATATAVLAGGCFWGVQAVYQHVRGVKRVVAGYSGGTSATARYDAVSAGRTKHAESVEITFDPRELSYGQILQVFFSVVHDPTQLDRQGPDVGPHYRSNVFHVDDAQRRVAQAYIAQLQNAKVFGGPIVTRLDPLSAFYPAEDYHQDFLLKNPEHPYIVIHDLPKLEHLRRLFPALFRDDPVRTALRPAAGGRPPR